jgi:hypothetical protein
MKKSLITTSTRPAITSTKTKTRRRRRSDCVNTTTTTTTEIFRIRKIQRTYPTTYLLDDLNGNPIQGGFYRQEIKKTHFPHTYLVEKILKRKGDRVFVRWLGFPTSQDSWVHKNEIL